MSGHSHYATIKRQKESNDAAKGKIFSKMARIIAIAAKTGGGADPESNYKLRMAIEQARAQNMPKVNIDRAIQKAQGGGDLTEVTYEGYGPDGIAILVDAATDNRNRTAQEIKNIFERVGGSLAGPGSVSYNFDSKGVIVVKKETDTEEQMLRLIDMGVEDLEETRDAIEVYTAPDKAGEIRDQLRDNGFEVLSFNLVKKPKTYVMVDNPQKATKVMNFLESLDEHEDVQGVYSNFDIPEEIASQIT